MSSTSALERVEARGASVLVDVRLVCVPLRKAGREPRVAPGLARPPEGAWSTAALGARRALVNSAPEVAVASKAATSQRPVHASRPPAAGRFDTESSRLGRPTAPGPRAKPKARRPAPGWGGAGLAGGSCRGAGDDRPAWAQPFRRLGSGRGERRPGWTCNYACTILPLAGREKAWRRSVAGGCGAAFKQTNRGGESAETVCSIGAAPAYRRVSAVTRRRRRPASTSAAGPVVAGCAQTLLARPKSRVGCDRSPCPRPQQGFAPTRGATRGHRLLGPVRS
jgi:hypothetical protein